MPIQIMSCMRLISNTFKCNNIYVNTYYFIGQIIKLNKEYHHCIYYS